MIDIHSHILPGLDDGAQTLEDALEMARLAVAGGTQVLFATPHVADRKDLAYVPEVAERVAALQTEVDRAEIPLRLYPGAEVDPLIDIPAQLGAGMALTLAGQGKYLLLDSPFTVLPIGIETIVYQIQLQGIRVILAHPERILPIQDNLQMLEGMVTRGLLLQVTASSLLGKNGPTAEKIARHILHLRWAHFVASDSHSPTRRRPGMAEAARELLEEVGAEVTQELLVRNGQRVLDNEAVPTDPLPFSKTRKRRFTWFGGRK